MKRFRTDEEVQVGKTIENILNYAKKEVKEFSA